MDKVGSGSRGNCRRSTAIAAVINVSTTPLATENEKRVAYPTVLIVDDEPAFRAVVSEILQLYGYQVYQANGVDEALTILDNHHLDLILTDLMMPDTDGFVLIRKLRRSPDWADIPIVVVTAKAAPDESAAANAAGANYFLTKPFSALELRQVLGKFLPV